MNTNTNFYQLRATSTSAAAPRQNSKQTAPENTAISFERSSDGVHPQLSKNPYFHPIQFQGKKSEKTKNKTLLTKPEKTKKTLPPESEWCKEQDLWRTFTRNEVLEAGLAVALKHAPMREFQATLDEFLSGLFGAALSGAEVIDKLQANEGSLAPESEYVLEMFYGLLPLNGENERFQSKPLKRLLGQYDTRWYDRLDEERTNLEEKIKAEAEAKTPADSPLITIHPDSVEALLSHNGFTAQGVKFSVTKEKDPGDPQSKAETKSYNITLSPSLRQFLSGFKKAFPEQIDQTFGNLITYLIEVGQDPSAPEDIQRAAEFFQALRHDLEEGIRTGKLTLAQQSDDPKLLEAQLGRLYSDKPTADNPNKMTGEQYRIVASLLDELKKLPEYASGRATLLQRIQTIIQKLPWSSSPVVAFSENEIRQTLAQDHAGLLDEKEAIVEHLAQEALIAKLKQSGQYEASEEKPLIVLFNGAPGVGKTSLAKSIARASNRKFVRIALGGVHDESGIKGHRPAYMNATYGRIIGGMIEAGVDNPVILLDEIDSLGTQSTNGDPSAALLEVLDSEQNKTFRDHFLDMPVDLSKCIFIATSNKKHKIPAALKDRFDVIELKGYTLSEKLTIAKEHLIPRIRRSSGLKKEKFNLAQEPLQLSDQVLKKIIRDYAPEVGVRQLENCLNRIAKKLAVGVINKPITEVKADDFPTITPENLERFLGTPELLPLEQVDPTPIPGQVHGLYYSDNGGRSGGTLDVGVILHERAENDPTKTGLTLGQITGSMAETMTESAKRAFSYVKGQAKTLKIDLSNRTIEVEIHSGDLTPKDGPSAGAALTLALISALKKQDIPGDFALTGEFNPLGEGKILPIGGLREKIAGAVEEGVKRIAIPRANVPHLKKIPEEILSQVEIIPVGTMAELMKVVWQPAESGTNTPSVTFAGNRSRNNVQTLPRKPFSQFA